jgi:hypothetical protein
MTSTSSAGPLLIDRAKSYVYFVDNNPSSPFIGRFTITYNISASGNTPYSMWLSLTGGVVTGFAMDAHWARRKIYWTQRGTLNVADGKIKWASMDASNPIEHDLNPVLVPIDPGGLAVHIKRQRLYWVDKDSTYQTSILYSSDLAGGNLKEVFLYKNVINVTQPTNIIDIKIDFRNDTVFFIDGANPASIVRTNLNFPNLLKAISGDVSQFKDYYNVSAISQQGKVDFGYPAYLVMDDFSYAETHPYKSNIPLQFNTPMYLQLDDTRNALLWTDIGLRRMKFFQYVENQTYSGDSWYTNYGDVYVPWRSKELYATQSDDRFKLNWEGDEPKIPVGMVIDSGQGEPQWGEYSYCHGNGVCLGLAGLSMVYLHLLDLFN